MASYAVFYLMKTEKVSSDLPAPVRPANPALKPDESPPKQPDVIRPTSGARPIVPASVLRQPGQLPAGLIAHKL